MGKAKQIILKVIPSKIANDFIKKNHYSGKVVPNSQLHFGVFYKGRLHGVMSFGASLDKSKIVGLVKNTGWNEFLELNRLAFDEVLPKNSESRALSIAFKMINKNAPHVKWIISYADSTQCGDGTIYRASGFILTAIKPNSSLYKIGDKAFHQFSESAHGGSKVIHEMTIKTGKAKKSFYDSTKGKASVKEYMQEIGAVPLKGFQLRYIYFIDKSKINDLTVPILPFSKIDEMGAGMYKGKKISIQDRKNASMV